MPPDEVIAGWDVGGAHVKLAIVARVATGDQGAPRELELLAVDQWACPLWQGLDRLQAVLAAAQARWPQLAGARHAVTMTGEMVDLFEHREAGVLMLAELLGATLGDDLVFWAGTGGGMGAPAWCDGEALRVRWAAVASARQRRVALPGRGAHAAVRAGAAHRAARPARQCDERVLRDHGRCAPAAWRPRP